MKVQELPNNGPIARDLLEKARAGTHRSVYLPLLRGITPTSLEAFDFVEQGMVTGRRDTTTVAPRALYLLNDPFVHRRALDLAEHVLAKSDLDDHARIDLAYRLALGRPSEPSEADRVRLYLADFESTADAIVEATPEPAPVAAKPAEEAEKPAARAPAPPIDPDQIIQVEAPIREEVIRSKDARTAAWASFCQALFGSAEFRYLK